MKNNSYKSTSLTSFADYHSRDQLLVYWQCCNVAKRVRGSYLVMVFAGSVHSGADMVGLLDVSIDGSAGEVSGRDGGQSRGGVD